MLRRLVTLGALAGLAGAVLVGLWLVDARRPAEAQITPPPGIGAVETNLSARVVTLARTQVVTADKMLEPTRLIGFGVLDVQYVIAFSGTNTTTLTLRHSNDGVNWVTGATLLANGTTAGTAMTQTHNFGQFTAVYADVTNSNPVTLTVIAVAR